ncbi:PTS system EIIBC component [Lactococcus lactis]|nr:PTS system EIIBC component [Lactococcus lactis]
MVMFGLHQILTPIHLEMIAKTGSTQLLPILAMAGAGQVGAAIALWLRLRKDKEFVELVKGALPVGILGIGEPLIYGITLPLGRPFITACIGGGIGGAIIGSLGQAGCHCYWPFRPCSPSTYCQWQMVGLSSWTIGCLYWWIYCYLSLWYS